jgi:N-acetyl sugar amidotransferase
MDTTDPEINFNSDGICNHCLKYDEQAKNIFLPAEVLQQKLDKIIIEIKEKSNRREYDCIIGVSGGVDSTYLAYKVKKFGLRPLAVHFDSGWNSELAVNNIENLLKKLNIDLYTIVVDWEEMRDLQLSFLKASVANADIPTDHAFVAVLYYAAVKKGIKYIISGHNFATESVLPVAWGYTSRDLRHIKSVQKFFGTLKLKKYPTINLMQSYIYYPYIKGVKIIKLLNYMPYVKKAAKEFLKKELGWRDYGGKHYESVFTRFFQGYYLPTKFGYDKRRAHLSSLILSGEISRKEALEQLEVNEYTEAMINEDKAFLIKKLRIADKDLENIMGAPLKTFKDYPSNYPLFKFKSKIVDLIRRLKPTFACG